MFPGSKLQFWGLEISRARHEAIDRHAWWFRSPFTRGTSSDIGVGDLCSVCLLASSHQIPLTICSIATFSNSLGPPVDQIIITEPLEQHIREVEKVYSLIFPYILCPPTLFIEIIRINRLRQDVMTAPFEDPSQHTLDAHDILARVEAFVPEDWAQPGDHHDDWQLIGSMYQSAIALYCTMSLQAVAALPTNLEMNAMRAIHGERLFENLKRSTQSKHLKKFSLFPLCVLGVEAGYHDDNSIRLYISQRLEDHSRLLGTSSPLKARAVLKRYWQRNNPGWDECFDGPYVFIL